LANPEHCCSAHIEARHGFAEESVNNTSGRKRQRGLRSTAHSFFARGVFEILSLGAAVYCSSTSKMGGVKHGGMMKDGMKKD